LDEEHDPRLRGLLVKLELAGSAWIVIGDPILERGKLLPESDQLAA